MTIDVSRLIGAVTRELSTREVDGRPARVLVASRTYDTSVEDLWDALTKPQRLSRWMGPIRGDFRLGGRFAIEGNASGTITTCKPPHHLAVTWEFQGNTSWVSVALEARSADVSHLRLEHVAHVPKEFWDEFGPGATGVGWELALAALESVVSKVEGGVEGGIPLGDQEAFAASDEGRRFLCQCSDAWADASIAAGTDEAAARAAAQQTTAFYSG
ncbi:MAG: SRPBCC family protein [Myxococcota bacterium]